MSAVQIFSVANGRLSELKQYSAEDYHVQAVQGQRMQSGVIFTDQTFAI